MTCSPVSNVNSNSFSSVRRDVEQVGIKIIEGKATIWFEVFFYRKNGFDVIKGIGVE